MHHKVQCWIFTKTPDDSQKPYCLLLKTNKTRGEHWQPVTGSVEPNEGYFEAACREPVEETGFTFNAPPLHTGYEFTYTSHNRRSGITESITERVFVLVVDDQPTPKLDPNEHQDFQWIEPSQALPLLRFPSNIEGLKRSYKLIYGKELL